MDVIVQFWRQYDGNRLISVCRDVASWRELRYLLLFAGDGVLPEGETHHAEATGDAPFIEDGLFASGFVFITEEELKKYVSQTGDT